MTTTDERTISQLTAVFDLLSAAHALSATTRDYQTDPTVDLADAYRTVIEARQALLDCTRRGPRPDGYQFAIDRAGEVLNEADDAHREQTGDYLPINA